MSGNGSAADQAGVVYVGAPWEAESCVSKFIPGRHSHSKPPEIDYIRLGRYGESTVPAGTGTLSVVTVKTLSYACLRCSRSSRISSIKNYSVK